MGIEGLSYLLARQGAVSQIVVDGCSGSSLPQPQPRRALIVDGPNWVKSVGEPLAIIPTAEVPFGSAFGGDHGAVALFVERVVAAFASRGVDLFFVFDTGKTRLEDAAVGRLVTMAVMEEEGVEALEQFFDGGVVGKLPFSRLRAPLSRLQRDIELGAHPPASSYRHGAESPSSDAALLALQGAEAGERLSGLVGSLQPLLRDPSRTLRGAVVGALCRALPAPQLLFPSGDDDSALARLARRLSHDGPVVGVWTDDTDFYAFAGFEDVPILRLDVASLLAAVGWCAPNHLPPLSRDVESAGDAVALSARVHDAGPLSRGDPDTRIAIRFEGRTGRLAAAALGLAAPRLLVDASLLSGGSQFVSAAQLRERLAELPLLSRSYTDLVDNISAACSWVAAALCACPLYGGATGAPASRRSFVGFPPRCITCGRPGRIEDHAELGGIFSLQPVDNSASAPTSPRSIEELDAADLCALASALRAAGGSSFSELPPAWRSAYARQYYALNLPSPADIVAAMGSRAAMAPVAATASLPVRATAVAALPISRALSPASRFDRSVEAARCLGLLPRSAYLLLCSHVSVAGFGLELRSLPRLPTYSDGGEPSKFRVTNVMCSHTIAAPLRAVMLGFLAPMQPDLLPPHESSLYLLHVSRDLASPSRALTALNPIPLLTRHRLAMKTARGRTTSAVDAAVPVPETGSVDREIFDARTVPRSRRVLAADFAVLHASDFSYAQRTDRLRSSAKIALSRKPNVWAIGGGSQCSGWFKRDSPGATAVPRTADLTSQRPVSLARPAATESPSAEDFTVMALWHLLGVSAHCIAAGIAAVGSLACTSSQWSDAQFALQRIPSLPEAACLLAQACVLQASEPGVREKLSDPLSFPIPARPVLRAAAAATWYMGSMQGFLDIAALLGLFECPERRGADVPLDRAGDEEGAAAVRCAILEVCQGDPRRLPSHLAARLGQPGSQSGHRKGEIPPPLPPQWRDLYEGRLFHAFARALASDGVSGLSSRVAMLLGDSDVRGDPRESNAAAISASSRPVAEFFSAAEAFRTDPLLLLPPHAAAFVQSSPASAAAFARAARKLFSCIDVPTMLRDQAAARAIARAGPFSRGGGDDGFAILRPPTLSRLESQSTRLARTHPSPAICSAHAQLDPPAALLRRLVAHVSGGLRVADHRDGNSDLPIAAHFDALLWAIAQCSFSLVLTETGSGKTVST